MKGRLLLLLLMGLGILCGAEPLNVCDVLENLSRLNGKDIKVTGVWEHGDNGGQVWAVGRCPHPTIRDGWQFVDAIQTGPEGGIQSGSKFHRELREFEKAHPGARVRATLAGRLQAPEHFKTWAEPAGVLRVRAFRDFAAQLRFWNAWHFVALPGGDHAIREEFNNSTPRRVGKIEESSNRARHTAPIISVYFALAGEMHASASGQCLHASGEHVTALRPNPRRARMAFLFPPFRSSNSAD